MTGMEVMTVKLQLQFMKNNVDISSDNTNNIKLQ